MRTACFTAAITFQSADAAISLHARARMNRNRFDPDLLGHARHVHGDDIVFVPAGTNLDRERNTHRGANGTK